MNWYILKQICFKVIRVLGMGIYTYVLIIIELAKGYRKGYYNILSTFVCIFKRCFTKKLEEMGSNRDDLIQFSYWCLKPLCNVSYIKMWTHPFFHSFKPIFFLWSLVSFLKVNTCGERKAWFSWQRCLGLGDFLLYGICLNISSIKLSSSIFFFICKGSLNISWYI